MIFLIIVVLIVFKSILYPSLDCPEEVTMGVIWERSLTNTTYKHQCSSIHPSFKLTDMVTRECMKNRSWGTVNMSQCIMDVDSPVVMILVVTLDTENTTLVKAEMRQIIEKVYNLCIITNLKICKTPVTMGAVDNSYFVNLKYLF